MRVAVPPGLSEDHKVRFHAQSAVGDEAGRCGDRNQGVGRFGVLGALAVGVAALGEQRTLLRGTAFLLILSGLFLMKLSDIH